MRILILSLKKNHSGPHQVNTVAVAVIVILYYIFEGMNMISCYITRGLNSDVSSGVLHPLKCSQDDTQGAQLIKNDFKKIETLKWQSDHYLTGYNGFSGAMLVISNGFKASSSAD